jgi:hypothetical protein
VDVVDEQVCGFSQYKKPRHPAGLPRIKSQWAGFGIVRETVPCISPKDGENPLASAWDIIML